jgi:selenocysteine lyase/cysteine desulfurase
MFAQKTRGNFEIDFYENELLQDIDALKKALHPKTRFLNLSQVGFQNGNRVDLLNLGRYLQQREIRFIVDVTQGLGGVSISPAEIELIDVMLCSTYKWLLAPYGQAFAFWSKRALQETSQTHGNWLTQPAAPKDLTVYSLNAKEGARRFDRGQAPNILGLKGLEASLTLFQELGLSEIERHNLELANYFTENFDRKRYQLVTKSNLKSSIVCLKANNTDIDNLMQKLKSSNVDISVREGNLRISFHLYNSKIQVERLLKVL